MECNWFGYCRFSDNCNECDGKDKQMLGEGCLVLKAIREMLSIDRTKGGK